MTILVALLNHYPLPTGRFVPEAWPRSDPQRTKLQVSRTSLWRHKSLPLKERLIRYVTVMSIIAWRLFLLTLLARAHPDAPCTILLTDQEWQVLYCTVHRTTALPPQPPTLHEATIWIARLGGFLARTHDGPPGTVSLWRGWKRLTDLTQGWFLATGGETCG